MELGFQQQPDLGAQQDVLAAAIGFIAFGSGVQDAPSVAQAASPAW